MITYFLIILAVNTLIVFPRKNIASYFLMFIIVVLIDYFLRTTPPDYDLAVYASMMLSESFGLYYIKEPVSFLTMRYLYTVLKDPNLVFFIIDICLIIFLTIVANKEKFPVYGVPLVLFNFVAILGHQNVYRQYIAMIILSGLVILFRKKFLYILGLFSIGAHNPSIIVLAGLIRPNGKLSQLMWAAVPIGLIVYGSKLETQSATSTPKHLMFSIVILILLWFVSYRKQDNVTINMSYFLMVLFTAIFVLQSGTAERIFMYIYMVLLPLAIQKNDIVIRPKTLGHIVIVNSSMFPFYLSSATILLE